MPIPGPAPHTLSPWPALKFVDAPDTTATVRLDLNDGGDISVLADDLSLGSPSLSGDPGSPAVEYRYRRLTLTVRITGPKATALLVQAALWREMLRKDNYLLFQLQPTSAPVWFHTYATEPGALSLDSVYDESTGATVPDKWIITVPLDADPFGMGAKETVASGVTVSMDPAAASNPCRYTIGATIKGDFPAPLVVNATWAQDKHGYQHFLATSRGNGYVWQVGGTDGWATGADTGTSTSDALFTGGSYRPVTFATTAAMADRITGPAPAVVTNGKYRVLVRVARSDTSSQFAFRFGQRVVLNYTYGPTVRAEWNNSATLHHAWVDLGVCDFPLGTDQAGTHTPDIALGVQRIAGTGTAAVDCIKLVPADGTVLREFHRILGPGAGVVTAITDSEAERFYYRNLTGPYANLLPEMAGVWPTVVPGSSNVVHMLSQTSHLQAHSFFQDVPDRIADTVAVTLTYRPRYLNLPS